MTAETDYLKAQGEAELAKARFTTSLNELKHRVSPPVLANDALASAREKANEALSNARDKAGEALTTARDKGAVMAETATEAARRNPRAAGAAAGVIGLLLLHRPLVALFRRLRGTRQPADSAA